MGEPNTAFAQYFIGNSYLKPLTKPGASVVSIANVTFEPGCRNNWHIHHASKGGGQILICVEGEGWYQEEGKPAQSLKPGDVEVEEYDPSNRINPSSQELSTTIVQTGDSVTLTVEIDFEARYAVTPGSYVNYKISYMCNGATRYYNYKILISG